MENTISGAQPNDKGFLYSVEDEAQANEIAMDLGVLRLTLRMMSLTAADLEPKEGDQHARNRRAALRWLNGEDSSSPFSFERCVAMLPFDADELRNRLTNDPRGTRIYLDNLYDRISSTTMPDLSLPSDETDDIDDLNGPEPSTAEISGLLDGDDSSDFPSFSR